MTVVIKSKLKERFDLTKMCYKDGERKPDFEKLIAKTNKCGRLFQLQRIF